MTSHENNGDNRETINPHNNADVDVDVDDDADNNDLEIEIPGIPSIPSITASTSETEEERRRILEGIFAEDDDDEDDDEEEEDAMLSFLSHQQQQQQQQVDDGAPDGHNSAARGASSIDEQNNSDDDIDESLPEEYPTQNQSSSSATIIPEHEQLLPNQAAAAARKARACESAFSSSSDEDEEFDEEQEIQPDNNNNKAAAEPVVTPRFSNTTTTNSNNQPQQPQQQQKQHFEFNEEDDNTTTTNNNKQPEDMMEATNNTQFSWIHSADEGEVGVGGVVDQHPSLSFNFTEDTMSTNKTTAADAAAAAAAAAADLKNNAQKQQHHQSQQSAFDRALNEVQAQGGRSRSNSFAFADATVVSSPKAGGDGGTTQQQQSETGGGHHVKNVNDEESSQSSGEGSSNNGDDSSGDSGTAEEDAADEDDFFAKAEHTVLDEIMDAATDPSILAADAPSTASSNPRKQSGSSSTTTTTNSGDTRVKDRISLHTNKNSGSRSNTNAKSSSSSSSNNNPTAGLPDVLNSVRQKIESFNIFDADVSKSSATSGGHPPYPPSSNTIPHNGKQQQPTNMLMMDTVTGNNTTSTAPATLQKYYSSEEEREAMRRAFQQSISAAVLVSLAHKRYERRRLAAMEIEKVVRSLVVQEDYSRVRAILLLLSDDYVRSTNEDARKGGAVALAACAIGLKKANESRRDVIECRDLILASVVHACQDHSQRVRYYATESLFNVTKVIPSLAVQHFFILFEILRSLYADVDLDVRSGAELLDKKLKEVIVGAINAGSFSADACVPVFARFVYMRNKATKQLTLTWLKEFSEKLIGAPILEFLHLFLGGIFSMVADPNAAIRQLALEFLQSVLPKLLVNNEDFEDAQQNKVDFDKILQALVLTMEHPDPFVRKVAMYWMSRIVQAHMSSAFPTNELGAEDPSIGGGPDQRGGANHSTAASTSVRSALAHILPGILLSIGDTHQSRAKDSFLPDQTAHSLAESANSCLQDAVRRDGSAFIPHLSGFIVALREELDSPGGLIARNPPSLERRPYRMDVKADGSGIESTGWFRASDGVEERDNALILSRLCALQWVVVLYEHVVPNSLKSEYAGEFIDCIIYQLVDQPPGIIIVKSFEVLAKISNPAEGEEAFSLLSWTSSQEKENAPVNEADVASRQNPMTDASANFALGVISESSQRQLLSRDRSVFASLIDLHSKHQKLLMDISKVIELMCTIQPPEFVFECFCLELDTFIISKMLRREKILESPEVDSQTIKHELASFAKDLAFVSNFAQQLSIVFFAAPETEQLRQVLKDSIGFKGNTVRDERRARLFHILLYTFSHNIVATLAFCLWGGAFLTASTFLQKIDPLDVSLMFYLEIDQLIDLIERPLFRHLHLRMLECEDNPHHEGSGAMLFRTLKSIMMLLPQSTSYVILKERLTSMARYRQSAVALRGLSKAIDPSSQTDVFVKRIVSVRQLHTDAKWRNIRAESLEEPSRLVSEDQKLTAAQQRREWLGYADEEEELATKEKIKQNLLGNTPKTAERVGEYEGLRDIETSKLAEYKKGGEECKPCLTSPTTQGLIRRFEQMGTGDEEKEDQSNPQWREYWASRQ